MSELLKYRLGSDKNHIYLFSMNSSETRAWREIEISISVIKIHFHLRSKQSVFPYSFVSTLELIITILSIRI